MANITIRMKDGTEHVFPHQGRAGGSYTKTVEFKDSWVIVTDEWDKRTAFPAVDVAKVEETQTGGRW